MCTRFRYGEEKDIYSQFDLLERKLLLEEPSATFKVGEVFPSEQAICLIKGKNKSSLKVMTFGYKLKNGYVLNARQETVQDKYLFQDDYLTHRGAILVNGFYEWDKEKNKYYFYSNHPLYLAIVYNNRNEFAILTTSPSLTMISIHDRQPVILEKEEVLNYINDLNAANKLIAASSKELLKIPVNYK